MVNLLNLNKTLAHQPWFVNPEQMKVRHKHEVEGKAWYCVLHNERPLAWFIREVWFMEVKIEERGEEVGRSQRCVTMKQLPLDKPSTSLWPVDPE